VLQNEVASTSPAVALQRQKELKEELEELKAAHSHKVD